MTASSKTIRMSVVTLTLMSHSTTTLTIARERTTTKQLQKSKLKLFSYKLNGPFISHDSDE